MESIYKSQKMYCSFFCLMFKLYFLSFNHQRLRLYRFGRNRSKWAANFQILLFFNFCSFKKLGFFFFHRKEGCYFSSLLYTLWHLILFSLLLLLFHRWNVWSDLFEVPEMLELGTLKLITQKWRCFAVVLIECSQKLMRCFFFFVLLILSILNK